MILLDTHAWIWWVSNPEELSEAARSRIDDAAEHSDVLVSCISTWEVMLLVAKSRLELSMDAKGWIAESERIPFVRFVPVDNQVAVKSVSLPMPFHSDPADRIIVATAMIADAAVVTKDQKLLNYAHVETIW